MSGKIDKHQNNLKEIDLLFFRFVYKYQVLSIYIKHETKLNHSTFYFKMGGHLTVDR